MTSQRSGMRYIATRVVGLLAVLALLVLTLVVTSKDDTTNTEAALWTFILFAIGVAISFYFGQKSVTSAAAEMVRPQARGAARRLAALGKGIQSFRAVIDLNRDAAEEIAAANYGSVPLEHVNLAYDTLYVQIEAQMVTVLDAVEDWREFEPAIVNELQNQGSADV